MFQWNGIWQNVLLEWNMVERNSGMTFSLIWSGTEGREGGEGAGRFEEEDQRKGGGGEGEECNTTAEVAGRGLSIRVSSEQ